MKKILLMLCLCLAPFLSIADPPSTSTLNQARPRRRQPGNSDTGSQPTTLKTQSPSTNSSFGRNMDALDDKRKLAIGVPHHLPRH